ncbi:MAG: ATP-binding cassette domain-containing protein [bacterium]|nr:ATP-binding cassette domain-containing protein [bacterium]
MEPIVCVKAVTKRFGDVSAVRELSLDVAPGTIYGLLGPNGAGKTTTLRMILGIFLPDEGTISVFNGQGIEDAKSRIGYLPEERGLYRKMKVGDVLRFFCEIKGVDKITSARRVDYWLDKVGLWDWKEKKVEELSRGMQQKVQFIATVIHEPDLLVLDEPFSGMDPVNTAQMKDIVVEQKNAGRTIILSTHIMEQAEKLCDEICLINKGRAVVKGPLSQLKRSYGTDSVHVQYSGDGSFIKQMPGVRSVDDYGNYIELKLSRDADASALLREICTKVAVTRFEVVEPSLNRIFIEKVSQADE